MTLRAVILGLLGAAAVCGFTYFNDAVMHQTMFIGNNMPLSVYGGLILFVLLLNPLLLLIGRRLALTGRELAVVLALTLAACCIPGSGLLRTFTSGLVMPRHFNRTETGWNENRITEMVPEEMLAGVGPFVDEEDILDPRGICSRLAGAEAGESSAPVRRIWSLISAEDRDAIRAALEKARAGPGESWRPRAERALSEAIDDARERRSKKRREDRKQKEGEKEPKEPKELSPADREALLKTISAALSPPGPTTPGSLETVKALDAELKELGFKNAERGPVGDTVAEALAEAEAPCREAAAEVLNGLLDRRDLHSAEVFAGVTLSQKGAALLAREGDDLSEGDKRKLNRHLIDASFPPSELRGLVAKEDRAVNGFVQGLSVGERHIGLGDVPWGAWKGTLWFWLPLILLLWIGLIALSVVVHRQWARHEQLPYPIASFANSLLPGRGEAMGSVFRNRLFWVGAAGVLFIHLNNYAFQWNADLVKIPTEINASSLRPLFPNIDKGGGSFAFSPKVYFTVVAFAYFLATDVSLSLGIGSYVYVWIVGILVGYGISVGGGGYLSPNLSKMQLFGSYLGILLTLIYTGRYYYASVFRKAAFLRPKEEVEAQAVWAARVFIVTMFMFIANLTMTGLDWQLAVLYTLGVVTVFLVMARISAETGLFFIQPYWAPCLILIGLLGPAALGPRTMLLMLVLTTVFLIDPRESIMPFIVNSFKLLDMRKVRIGRTAILCGAAVIVGLAVGLTVTLYFQYDRGANMQDGWANGVVPKYAFEDAVKATTRLEAQGSLEQAEAASGFGRLKYASTSPGMLVAFALGLGLVLVFMVARWRLPKWPLHPVMFLIWSSMPGMRFAASFLLGWFIKAMVVKYGGESVFRKLKPLMFGLIAGDMLGGIIPTIIGLCYYAITGKPPQSYNIMPG